MNRLYVTPRLLKISGVCAGLFFLVSMVFPQDNLSFVNIDKNLGFTDQEIITQSVAHPGTSSAIKAVLQKAENGEDIVIGAIGGSITMGAAASTAPENRYINLVARWFCHTYPDSKVTLFNAGIGATNSKFGALRARHDLLQYNPDLVIFEFSVNDNVNNRASAGSEGLIRQILGSDNRPGLIMLGMMNKWVKNVQHKHMPLAIHYNIPFFSLRNLCEERITGNRLDPGKILADAVHPNTTGHRLTARMIILQLEKIRQSVLPAENHARTMPEPLYTDIFEKVEFTNAPELKFVDKKGWHLTEHAATKDQHWRIHDKPIIEYVWNTRDPDNIVNYHYTGTFFAITFYQYPSGTRAGSVTIEIDGISYGSLDGEGEQTWGGMHKTVCAGMDLPYKTHRVSLKWIPPGSEETPLTGFDIIAFSHGTK